MKKCLILLAVALTAVACNKEETGDVKIRGTYYNYATVNKWVGDGHLINNISFYGSSTVETIGTMTSYTDKKAHFELTGESGAGTSILYMHATKFAAMMPGVEMRIPALAFTGSGKVVTATKDSVNPENQNSANAWVENTKYTITALTATVNDLTLKATFTVAGRYKVTYEGRLVESIK